MKRVLKIVKTEQPIGELEIDSGGVAHFRDDADDVLNSLRRKFGDRKAARLVMRDGWSNGYVYFADPE